MRRRALLYTSGKNPGYITVNPTPNTLTYNGTAQELVSAGSGSGTILYSIDNLNFYNTIPTSTNAGDYIVYYKAAESGGFFETEVYSVSCTISKAAGYVSTAPSAKSLTYTGNALELVNVGSGSGTMYYSTDDTNWSTSVPTGTNATTYTVYYKVAEASNYTESASYNVSVTIGKANPTYTAPTANALTYNGNAQYLITTGSTSHGTIQYSADDSSWSTTRPTGTNAGSYTSYWKLVGDTNHSDTTSASISTTIAKAGGSVTTAPANTGYAYNGTARALASAGAGTGTMYYRLGTSGNFTTSIPTASAPGSWTLYYYAAASTNYNLSSTGSITVTQVKASLNAPTATGATVTYGSTATASASGGGGQGSIEWSNGNTRTAVGSLNTLARWSGNTYYNASAWSGAVTLTVNKAAGSVTKAPTNTGYAYNGTARALANAGSGTGTMYYRLGTSGSFSTSIPTASAPGSWTLYYYAAASTNYNQSGTGSITVTLVKANQNAPTATGATVTYGSTATATASGGGGLGSIEWSNGNTRTAVGSQSTQARWGGNTYYNASGWSNSVTLTVNKANSAISFSGNASVIKGKTITKTASRTAGDGTITYSSSNTNVATVTNAGVVTGKAAGSCTITATTSATTNYNAASASYTLTVFGNGVYAYYSDGSLVAYASATTSATGVAVITDNCSFVLSKNLVTNKVWDSAASTHGVISGASVILNTANYVYTGYSDTQAIIKVSGGCEACRYCTSNGGYLGSNGEWKAVYDNSTNVSNMLTKIGGTAISGNIWTSTQASASGTNFAMYLMWSTGANRFANKNANSLATRVFYQL